MPSRPLRTYTTPEERSHLTSYCGGLPTPEASDNPLGYKFSWSFRGILLALRNAARYYKDGKGMDIASKDLMGTAKPYFIYPGYAFVAYPNRDSTPYKERYNIPEAQTIIRGTLRYHPNLSEFRLIWVSSAMMHKNS
jgi:saccharopine dehydrogenase (NADP+, L-glutamate forming)